MGLKTCGEDVEDARDGLGSVVGVQRSEDEVPGLGGGQGGGHGLAVAHLADEDDIGILPQDGANCLGKSRRVGSYFDLFDERAPIRLLKFDRVLDRDDVVMAVAIDGA